MAVGCPKPVEVTYEVRSMSAMEASIQYWEEPGEKQVKLERQALPFRKTVQIAHPGDWSTNVTAQVAMGQDVTCAVYFNGEQVRIENTSFLCVANAHYR